MKAATFLLSVAPLALFAAPALAAPNGQTDSATPQGSETEERTGDQDIIVTGLRASLQSAQRIKQTSDSIVDALVAQDIGKLPDNQAAEALARLPGVQVTRYDDEATGVLVRGLPDVTSTYNGREIFTAQNRNVALQDFPAQALAGIEVYKSGTADLIEPGLAGLINVRSRRPLDFKGLFVGGGFRGTYNDQSKKYDPTGNILVSDRWTTPIGEIGILANVTYAQQQYRNAVRYNDQSVQKVSSLSPVTPATAGNQFYYPYSVGLYSSGGRRYRPSGNMALQWKPSDKFEVYFDGIYQGYRGRQATDWFAADLRGIDSVRGAPVISNVVLMPGRTDQAASLTKSGGVAPTAYRSTGADYTNTYQGAFGAIWHTDKAVLSTDLAYTSSEYGARSWSFDSAFANSPTVNAAFDVQDGSSFDFVGFDAKNPDNYIWRGYYESRGVAKGKGWQWRGDLVLDTEIEALPEIKFGFRYTDRDASANNGNRYAYTLPLNVPLASLPVGQLELIQNTFRGDAQKFTQYLMPTRDGIAGNVAALRTRSIAALRQLVALNPTDTGYRDALTKFLADDVPIQPYDQFYAKEQSYAAYAQSKYHFDIGSVGFDGTFGVRLVNTAGTYSGTSRIYNNDVETLTPQTIKQNYVDVLPNLSLRIKPLEQLQLRFAYTKTRTRPDFGTLNPALVITQNIAGGVVDPDSPLLNVNATGSGGNPDLKPLTSNNYDVSAEYYPTSTSSITFAAFYRDLFGFIGNYERQIQDPVFGVVRLSRPENAGKGKIKGFEVGGQTFFDFLPGALSGFGVQGNVTFINGRNALPEVLGVGTPLVRLTGVSKWSGNASVFYEKYGVTTRLSYNYRSDYISNYRQNTDGSQYTGVGVRAIKRLDYSLSYDVLKQVTLSFDVTNILAGPFKNFNNYTATRTYPVDVRYEGRYIGLGFRFRFGE
ncbi:TonB-dependent receptor [Sphingomonas taxi]|uniref:TonB-dependent receptor n=1 Tax=Sphingomonas taxi TaxID=1549858 RepID=A0A097ECV8_9SPHN|nr:TonB-dependent receptor [Sphingomonas taxi]AIT05409.1 TonB-dependent receptor [Sphingomonas taxi]